VQLLPQAKAKKVKGLVILDALIGTDGRISDIQVLQGATEQAVIELLHRARAEDGRGLVG
jgi:hypothetical protein